MISRLLFIAIFCGAMPTYTLAKTTKTLPGAWHITEDIDRFDGNQMVVAVTAQPPHALLIRCLRQHRSIALRQPTPQFKAGQQFDVLFKADDRPAMASKGRFLSENLIVIDATNEVLDGMRGAKRVSFRTTIDNKMSMDQSFTTRSLDRVISIIEKACPNPTTGPPILKPGL